MKTALITGCSSGIGQALVKTFQNNAFFVYATARKIDAIQSLEDKNVNLSTLNVTSADDRDAIVRRIEEQHGHLDILVNNAGYGAIGPLAEIPPGELQRQFDTNVFAPILLIQAVLPLMKKSNSGLIVNIGSVSGILTSPFAGAYCASKAALHSLSDALRVELAPFNIKVMTVQPGAIRSNFGDTAHKSIGRVLKENSVYLPIKDAIHDRAYASQKNPTSADDFAGRLITQILQDSPRSVVRIGNESRKLPFLKALLPETVIDKILSKKFKLDQLKKKNKT